MNPIYEQEIKQLTDNLGLKPEFILVQIKVDFARIDYLKYPVNITSV